MQNENFMSYKTDTEKKKRWIVDEESAKVVRRMDKIIQRLYEDSVLGKLRDTRFQKLSAQYETEQAEIQQLADKYSDLQELDAVTVNELIEKIVIQSPEKIDGKKHATIEVYFTYVGKIRIPLSKPETLVSTEKPV